MYDREFFRISVFYDHEFFRIKGQPQFSQENLVDMLNTITEDLYPDDEDLRDPKVGFTAAAILQLCKEVEVPIHIKWGEHKEI